MSTRVLATAAVALGLAVTAQPTIAQEDAEAAYESAAMRDVAADDLEWGDIEVPGFLPGMQIAPIHGDPSVADEPYVLRLSFPDGYAFPPHWHPRAENVTVLEGTFLLAMGREFDEEALETYEPGDYLFIDAENPHFGQVEGRTVVQLHGVGPFDISVVEGQEMTPEG